MTGLESGNDDYIYDVEFWKSLAQQNDLVARLVGRFQPKLYRYALRQCGNHNDAEDLVQELYVKLLSGKFPVDPTAPIAWMNTVIRNDFLHLVRSTKRTRATGSSPSVEAQPDPCPRPEEHMAKRGMNEQIADCLSRLAEGLQQLLALYFWKDKNWTEIGELLDLSPSTVVTRKNKAMSQLRACLLTHSHDFEEFKSSRQRQL